MLPKLYLLLLSPLDVSPAVIAYEVVTSTSVNPTIVAFATVISVCHCCCARIAIRLLLSTLPCLSSAVASFPVFIMFPACCSCLSLPLLTIVVLFRFFPVPFWPQIIIAAACQYRCFISVPSRRFHRSSILGFATLRSGLPIKRKANTLVSRQQSLNQSH